MRCPKCFFPDSHVTNSRSNIDHSSIRRRRECDKCGHKFTTYENFNKNWTISKTEKIELRLNKVKSSLLKIGQEIDYALSEEDEEKITHFAYVEKPKK